MILDSDVPRAKTVATVSLQNCMALRIKFLSFGTIAEGWPLMDGVVYKTNVSEQLVYDTVGKVTFDMEDVMNFEELRFYDGVLRAPANSSRYLKARYGSDCLQVQRNKCNKKGNLFRNGPMKCNGAAYRGALDFPYEIRRNIVRGEIMSALDA